MKQVGYVLRFCLCSFIFFLSHAAVHDQESLLQANSAYVQGLYAQARDLYNAIEYKNYAVWFNLGNCAYHLDEYAKAYACWLCSESTAPTAVQSALEHQYALLAKKSGVACIQRSWLDSLLLRISIRVIQLVAIGLWLIFWFLVGAGYGYTKKYTCIIIGALAVMCGILTAICYKKTVCCYAVAQNKVTVYAGPNEQYHSVGQMEALHAGSIGDRRDGWYKISCKDTVGWVAREHVIVCERFTRAS